MLASTVLERGMARNGIPSSASDICCELQRAICGGLRPPTMPVLTSQTHRSARRICAWSRQSPKRWWPGSFDVMRRNEPHRGIRGTSPGSCAEALGIPHSPHRKEVVPHALQIRFRRRHLRVASDSHCIPTRGHSNDRAGWKQTQPYGRMMSHKLRAMTETLPRTGVYL